MPIAGFVCIGSGLALLFAATGANAFGSNWGWAAIGGVLVTLGGVLCAPWLVSRFEPLAGRLSGSARLAARRIARNRARSGPVVGAIMATTAAAIAVSAITASSERGQEARYTPQLPTNQVLVTGSHRELFGQGSRLNPNDLATIRDRVVELVPGARTSTYAEFGGVDHGDGRWTDLRRSGVPGRGDIRVVLGSVELLKLVGAPADVVAAFERGDAIAATDEQNRIDGIERVTSNLSEPERIGTSSPEQVQPVDLDIYPWAAVPVGQVMNGEICDESGCRRFAPPLLIVPPVTWSGLGLGDGAPSELIVAPGPLTKAQRGMLNDLQNDVYDELPASVTFAGAGPQVIFENHDPIPLSLIQLILGAVALLLALGVTAVALSLAAVDNRPDDATLAALGAPPGTRRRVRAWEGFGLAAVGVVLAIPIGFLPAIAVRSQRDSGDPIVFPWSAVALLVVVLPLAAWAVGWLTARTPRRVDASAIND